MHTNVPSLTNKVFTDNPLLDEIIYNARQLATRTILKDENKADNCETLESMQYGDALIAINKGTVKFSDFEYDYNILYSYYLNEEAARSYAQDNNLIPESDRQALLKIAKTQFSENYEEYNNYYRMLHGLPDYDPSGIYEGLCIDPNQIDYKSPVSMEYIHAFCITSDYVPIHELDLTSKNIIYENGTCEAIINNDAKIAELNAELNGAWDLKKDGVYYLMHIGDREVDYYDARNAPNFSILYCPNCDSEEVKSRYKELFEANRLYMLYTVYSDAYKLRSDYYDNFMMIFLIIQTIIDMIVELPEYIIRRDIFDARTCKYIFESNGVKYFDDIPLKYQISLVKNLNKLIKFKSTDKCIVDIISIFGAENVEVFKYYILKDRNIAGYHELPSGETSPLYYNQYKETTDTMGNVNMSEDNDINYDLKFIRVPMLESYDDYIRKESNIYSYDSMTDGDNYWIGEQEYESIKSDIKDLDFTVLRSKYYSIEAVIDLAKRNFTMTYFMNMLMYNKIDSSALSINLPNISTSKKFEIIDIIITLYSLSYIYYGVEDTIIDTRAKAAQILGFDLEADLGKIASWLEENHRGLTLKDLHVDTYKVAEKGKIMSFNELEDMFFSNKDCYDHIHEVMKNPPSKEIYNAYRYLEKALLTTNRNMEYFLIDDIPKAYKNYKHKFVEIPRMQTYFCPVCHALIDLEKLISGEITVCPVCRKTIEYPYIQEYRNEEDFKRDYKWFMDSTDYETLYFVLKDDFDSSHMIDLYVKKDDTSLEKVNTIRMAYTYSEFLRYKDSTLYGYLNQIIGITNIERRQEACVNAIQEIISYLKDYIDQDGEDAIPLDTVFSGLPSVSIDFIKNYIAEVVEFFKSFKIFIHGSSILYVIDDKFDNYVQLIEHILLKYLLDKSEVIKIEDAIGGKINLDMGQLLHKGPGIRNSLSHEDKFKMIDKVWFSISRSILKYFNDYYNSENYEQASLRIREVCERFSNIELHDDAFTEHYIKELEASAMDAILQTLIDITKSDTVIISESLKTKYSQEFKEYYNEWLADIAQIIGTLEMDDKMPYQDDYVRNDFYNLYTVYPINDRRRSIQSAFGINDRYRMIDSYSSIVTQEFPEHSFDA